MRGGILAMTVEKNYTYQKVSGTLSPGAHAGSYNGQDAYNDMLVTNPVCYGICSYDSNSMKSDNPKSGFYEADTTRTLDNNGGNPACNQGGMAVCEKLYDMTHANDVIRECDTSPTLQSRMGTGSNQIPLTVENNIRWIVRRLTPLECERLQGFPDGWTDLGDWTDSKGKMRKASDTPRYKALGNSIALPFWKWIFRNMAKYLPEGATLGSLFSGIGGFDIAWEEIHGIGTSKWSSEIEEFPIAVMKRHFGDECDEEKGDLWKYLHQ